MVAAARQGIETEETRLEERKLDALSEFAAGAGHELNNPLAVIVGRAQLLLSRTDDPETATISPDHDQPGRSCTSYSPRLDVCGPPAARRFAVAGRQNCSATRRVISRKNAPLEGSGSRARSTKLFPQPGSIPMHYGISRIYLFGMPSRPRRPVARSRWGRVCKKTSYSGGLATPVKDSIRPRPRIFSTPFIADAKLAAALVLGLPRAARIVEIAGGD